MAMAEKNMSCREIFKEVTYKLYVEYLEKSQTHGLRMIRRTEGDSIGRYIWLGFMAFILILTHLDIYRLAIEFIDSPTETRLSPKVVHVKNVPFPAVAVCSNNQISKRALKKFTEELFEYQQKNYPCMVANSTEELSERIQAFRGLFMNPFDVITIVDQPTQNLHHLLTYKYGYGNGTYPVRTILRALSPTCEELIVRCFIANKLIDCTKIFFMRTTTTGICCMFNYKRLTFQTDNKELYDRDMETLSQSATVHFNSTGASTSLQIVIQDDIKDYTSTTFPLDGFKVLCFYPTDYPDLDVGSITKVLVGYNEDYEISIQPDILEGSKRMKHFPPRIRQCYFLEEGQKILKQPYYSFTECFLNCRTRSVIRHCGCVVPILPAFIPGISYCGLMDVPCITAWKAIWWQWQSFDFVTDYKNDRTVMDQCKYCLPNCDVISYKVHHNSRPLNLPRNKGNFTLGVLEGITSSKPTSVVRFFYRSAFSQAKTHDVSGDWIVLLARYGGICSIMYGFSIVAIFEIFYFLTGKWFVLWWRAIVKCYRIYRARKVGREEQPNELYWNEMRPKGIQLGKQSFKYENNLK